MNIQKKAISRDYYIIFSTILFAILFLSLSISFINYKSNKKELYHELVEESSLIDKELTETFEYVDHLIFYIGNQIVENKITNLEDIAKILQGPLITSHIVRNQFSWAMFDWDTPNKKMVVSTLYGILKEPKDVSHRYYAKMASIEPWKMHFDPMDIGISSREMVIPAGTGITDKKGKFIGIVSLGFSIKKLNSQIRNIITNSYISFLVLDNNFNATLYSEDNHNVDLTKEILNKFKNLLDNSNSKNGYLENEIITKNIMYVYYKKLDNYPFTIVVGFNKELLSKNFNTLLLPNILSFVILGICCVFLLTLIRYKMIKPIEKISQAAEKISKGELEVYIPESETKEINTLANNLKEIQRVKKELYHTQSLLRDANQGLADKIRERTNELEKALEVKTEFLNNISHEVRTPIHGVTAITQGIVDHWDDLEEDRKKDLAKQAAMAANRLFSLVNNILDLSKMSNNKMDLHLVNTDLFNLSKEVIEESRELYLHDKKIDLVIKEPKEQIPVLLIDKQLITQVFRNLITNAIKFTKEGKIEVSFERKDYRSPEGEEGIYIRIKDEGVGIPKGEEKEIFGAFTQSTRTKTRAGGTGLGLAICKEIVEMHAGKIWAENNKEKGASFYFVLPIDQDIEERIKQGEVREVPKVNILLIDDERLCIESMKMMLTGSEFEITGAEGGSAGLAYLGANSNKIDLILLDMMMPDMYGLEVLEKIKNNPQLDHIPVILQTGLKKEDEIQKAYHLGIVNFISKPYKKDEILKVLRTSIRFKYSDT